MNEQERMAKVDEALNKKFDGKPSPRVVEGGEVRKAVSAMLMPLNPDKGVSTTADEELNYAGSLRTLIQYETDVLRMEKQLALSDPDTAAWIQPMIDTHVQMIGDLNERLKECLGVESGESSTEE